VGEKQLPASVRELLSGYTQPKSGPDTLVLGVRLQEGDHVRLEVLAEHFGVPKATFARDLLRASISEALGSLQFDDHDQAQAFLEDLSDRIDAAYADLGGF